MNIFKRIWNIIKANINWLLGKAEDPVKTLEQLVIDMRGQMQEAKIAVAGALADEKKLKRQMEQQLQIVKEWDRKATLAVEKGDDNLAMQALERQTQEEDILKGYEKAWESQKATVDKLKSSLRNLYNKIQEAQRKKNLLIARAKRVEAQKRINQIMGQLDPSDAMSKFNEMERKISDMEARIDAEVEVQKELSGDQLENKFKHLENKERVQEKLTELKKRLGK
ncbi:MAG: PspA/IM30 family protein [Spirochaetota bacterium]